MFDNFVIGQFNCFVYVVVVVVVEVLVKVYNLFFIYGDFGLGKIYFFYVIGDYVQFLYVGVKVCYVLSEEFMNDFINLIVNNCGVVFQV